MKRLLNDCNNLKKRIGNKPVFLFLDYDGTLTPIAKTPAEAVMPVSTRALLRGLLKTRGLRLAVISGRALADIKKTVGIKGLIYAANHGLEIEGPGIRFDSLISPRLARIMGLIKSQLYERFSRVKGILIEDKGLTLSLHYRLAPKQSLAGIRRLSEKILKPYVARNKVKVGSGKKVFEIRPFAGLDKGTVVLWLLSRPGLGNAMPIYIGDDITDEDAFRALKGKGITVYVGKSRSTGAEYYLKDTGEVIKFLEMVPALRGQEQSRCRR